MQNCNQIYNNFYNIFNPEIQNNIQYSEINKNIHLSKAFSKENVTYNQEVNDYKMDIVDYKRLLNEKNEYIKILLSENYKLKDKVYDYSFQLKWFGMEYKNLLKRNKELSENTSNFMSPILTPVMDISIKDNNFIESEHSILAAKLKLKPPRSRTQNLHSNNISAEIVKRNGCASVNNNEYISTIEDFKPNFQVINAITEPNNNCSLNLNQDYTSPPTLRSRNDLETIKDTYKIVFNMLKSRTQRILDQYLEKIHRMKK